MSSFGEVMDQTAAVDLLEECWFFDNLLNRRARMLRCYSDPCSSSTFGHQMLDNNSSHVHLHHHALLQSPIDFGRVRGESEQPLCHSLVKSPSLPIDFGSEKVIQGKGSRRRMTKSSKHPSPNSCLPRHASKNSHTSCEEEEAEGEDKESDFSLSKLIQQPTIQQLLLSPSQPPYAAKDKDKDRQPLRRSLLRSPSLPSGFGREKPIQDNENHRRTTKSRQPSPINSSDVLPPRHASKGMAQSNSIPRSKNTEAESVNEDNIKEMRRRYLNHSKSRKNLNDFESQEVQGFKDLGFKFDKQDLNPCVVNILPGLQAKTEHGDELEKEKASSKPYLSEEWLVQSYGPKIPHWGAKKSPEHMKAQIKYWARAVASNVH